MALKRVTFRSILLFAISAVLVFMLVHSVYAYNNNVYGFSMTPPSGWTVNVGVSGTVVMFVGPVVPETGGNVNINVVVGNTTETLSQASDSIRANYPIDFTNFSIVSENSRNIGGLISYEIVYTFTQQGFDFKEKQVLLIENGTDFIISCTATPSNYDAYLTTFDQSIQTFQLAASSSSGYSDSWIFVAVAVIIIAIIVIAFMFLRRRPKSESQQTMPPPPPPPPET